MSAALRTHYEKLIALTDEEFDYVWSHYTVKRLKKRQFLLQEGDPVLYNYFVVKGLLKASHIDEEGKEHILQFAMEDWWVSDYQAYYHRTPATLTIDCIEDVELLCLSLDNSEKLSAEMPKIEHFQRKKSNAGYIALQRRILSLLNNNPRQRYEQFVALYPTLLQRLPKTLIAAYLGVSRETLSRLSNP